MATFVQEIKERAYNNAEKGFYVKTGGGEDDKKANKILRDQGEEELNANDNYNENNNDDYYNNDNEECYDNEDWERTEFDDENPDNNENFSQHNQNTGNNKRMESGSVNEFNKAVSQKKSQHDKILQEDNFSRNRDNQNSNNSIKKEQVKRFNSTQNYYSMATFDDLQKNSELIEENLELYNETTNNSAFQDEDPNDEMNKTKKLDFYHRPSNHITEPSERHEPAVKKLTDPQEGLMGTNMIKLEDLDLKDYDYEDSLENIESGDKKIYSKVSPIKGQQPIKDITSYIDDL